ncbi:MAG: flagellar motor switch protein FliN [Fibromonadaceae bacterium]|jgi:flagellar motor switch protein FliN/FliY|nr:flagellar motor switch protein FliN [Fibromonadaceae bacterium]
MAGDGILSQDEIDLLTKSLLSSGDAPATAAAPVAAPTAVENTAEAARPFFKVLCEQASSVVTTVLSRAVDFQLQWLVAGENSVIPDELTSQSLYIGVEVKKAVVGKMFFAISKPEVATLSDLMLMGSGHSDYTDEHKDAICEIINQITGSCITVMDSQLHLLMDFGQASVSDFSGKNDDFKGCAVATVLVKIEEFPDRKILIVLDSSLFPAIRSKMSSKMSYASADTSLASLGLSSTPAFAAPAPSGGGDISGGGGGGGAPVAAPPLLAPQHSGGPFGSTGNKALDLLMDIELPIVIELGRTQMSLKRILELGPGAIVEMDRLAGEPVDILINGKVVARGEVVVVDENFGVRILALVSPEERLKLLR